MELLLDSKAADAPFAIAQLARASGDRARDLPDEQRSRAAEALRKRGSPPEWARAVVEVVPLADADAQRVFGESLPLGLHLS
jgi:hypothetical protein